MAYYQRALEPVIRGFKKRMIFISGPRQSGKTTLARHLLAAGRGSYFNWDDLAVRRAYFQDPHFLDRYLARRGDTIFVFDEIHKLRQWKNLVKGLYDHYSDRAIFVITGSARLDLFLQAGDSLAGRYFPFTLNPFGVAEYARDLTPLQTGEKILTAAWLERKAGTLTELPRKYQTAYRTLYEHNAFPEVAVNRNRPFLKRWHDAYLLQVAREDVAQLAGIQKLKTIENLMLLLPERVGSPLSISNLMLDLAVAHETVGSYVELLKRAMLIFEVPPYHIKLARAIRKERKMYFYAHSLVKNEGCRYENFVALQLRCLVDRLNNAGLGSYQLHFVKDRDGREADFLVTNEQGPLLLLEAKLSDTAISPNARYWGQKLGVPLIQLVHNADAVTVVSDRIFVIPAWSFLAHCS